jgi:ribosomal-protein-serine acetyltransferase
VFSKDLGEGAELRILALPDAPAFLHLAEENRDYLKDWIGWANTIHTPEDARAYIRQGLMRFAEDGLPWSGIWQDGQFAGGVMFFPVEPRIRATEVGYWLARWAAGRGLMTRALEAVLAYAFTDVGINRIMLQAAVDNARSRAVAERMGFTLEGIRRHTSVRGDRLIDMASYAMLAEDWRGRSQG